MNPFIATPTPPSDPLTVEDLHDERRFRPFATLPFDEIAPFVKAALKHRTVATYAYWLLALVPLVGLMGWLGYAVGAKIKGTGALAPVFGPLSVGVLCTFLLIPLHEWIHGLAFRYFGARDVRYGTYWRQFVFYAVAHRHVIGPRAYQWVALAPFLAVTALLGAAFLLSGGAYPVFFLAVYTFHTACCGGDFGIAGYLTHHRDRDLHSYDDAETKTTFFFERA
ncbi:MAG: DUF3267 domain-containing protein [Catalinimonas sp.]